MYRVALFAVLMAVISVLVACPGKTKTAPTAPAPVSSPVTPTTESSRVAGEVNTREPAESVKTVSFSRDVLPILKELAGDCHTADNMAGNYGIDSYEAVMAGGTDSTPNVIPGQPEKSLLYIYLTKGHPFGVKPDSAKLMVIYEWIRQGAKNN